MDLFELRKQLESGKSIFDLPLSVVFYARVSTDRDAQLNSLDNQVNYYTNLIEQNKNWTFCGGYIDEGISGTSVKGREKFLRMIDDGIAGRFDLIITKEISRFARDTLDSISYTRRLLGAGVGVFFQSDNINTLMPDAELRLTIMASLAQDEMRRLSERVKFGMKRAYESGKILGTDNLYGYNKSGCALTINEQEAQFVRELFNLYAEDKYGFRTIAAMLTERGYRNKSGGEINPGSLKSILSNPKYKGYYRGRLTESADYRTKKAVPLPASERLLYKDEGIPAIVSEELWNRVNAILGRRTQHYYNEGYGSQRRFAYTGKIKCGTHGTHHYRKVWKDRKIPAESWCCKEYLAKGRRACATPHLYTADLDALLEHIGGELLSDNRQYVEGVDALLDLYQKAELGNANASQEIAKLSRELDKNQSKQSKLLEMYADGDIEKSYFLKTTAKLNDAEKQLSQRIEQLRADDQKRADTAATLATVRDYLLSLPDRDLTALDVARDMLECVTILEGSTAKEMRVEIELKLGRVIPATILKPFSLYGVTEVSPIVGSEKQSEELVHYLLSEFEENPDDIWGSNIFGKSLHDLVSEGLNTKLKKMPEDARDKLRETLQRIINEGSGGLICIIL